jgi:undecaprenyl-diphosphatase
MVTVVEALILAIIQGLTEWLPVSSSGHLVIAQQFLGLNPPLIFDLMLHVGTLVVVLFVFRKTVLDILKALAKGDFKSENGKLAGYIIVGSVPIALVGVLLRDTIEQLFSSLTAVGIALLFTASVLLISEKRLGNNKIGLFDSILVGAAQAVAIIPGVSRSGLTVSTGLLRKIDKQTAFRFSFLLSAPAILGATVFELKDLAATNLELAPLIAGTIVAMVVGYLSLKLLERVVMSEKFHFFSYYCMIVGAVVLVYAVFL